MRPLHLYRHQKQAIGLAANGRNYVVTTGTGSGKSLTYIIPVVNHVLRHRPGDSRVRAFIVYPMNALINSQAKAIERFFYTGQETVGDSGDFGPQLGGQVPALGKGGFVCFNQRQQAQGPGHLPRGAEGVDSAAGKLGCRLLSQVEGSIPEGSAGRQGTRQLLLGHLGCRSVERWPITQR